MARHYKIVIKVAYEEGTVPDVGMEEDLRRGIDRAVGEGLLNDAAELVVIEEYTVKVKETTK